MKKNLIVAGLIAIAGSLGAQGYLRNAVKSETIHAAGAIEQNLGERTAGAVPQENGLTWYPFEEGYAKAVSEGKILLIDAYTDWCGWCKVMDRKTYADPAIIAKLNESFICVKLNPELTTVYNFKDKKWGGSELLQFLGNGSVTGFPTTIFWMNPASSNDRIVQPGFLDAIDFSGLLEMAKGKKS
jgi:thiol:disulfide interchange protein